MVGGAVLSMSDMKTRPTDAPVDDFIASIDNAGRREDAGIVRSLMDRVTGSSARMWGDSLIGYGEYDYARADGTRHMFFVTGFSPRKANMSIYLMSGASNHSEKLALLGKHKHSVSCLYLGRLTNIDLDVLEEIVGDDIALMRQRYPDCRI